MTKNKTHNNHSKECETCGEDTRQFVHMCPDSSNVIEVDGCPHCDDECGFCGYDVGGEG
jgi:hypothetical protein